MSTASGLMVPDPTRLEMGYWLSSEEHASRTLVRNARRAEEVGFSSAMISDHFHPWTAQQGQSPFVWSVLGAIAEATAQLRVGRVSLGQALRGGRIVCTTCGGTVPLPGGE